VRKANGPQDVVVACMACPRLSSFVNQKETTIQGERRRPLWKIAQFLQQQQHLREPSIRRDGPVNVPGMGQRTHP